MATSKFAILLLCSGMVYGALSNSNSVKLLETRSKVAPTELQINMHQTGGNADSKLGEIQKSLKSADFPKSKTNPIGSAFQSTLPKPSSGQDHFVPQNPATEQGPYGYEEDFLRKNDENGGQFYQPKDVNDGNFYRQRDSNDGQFYQMKDNIDGQFYQPQENGGEKFYQPQENGGEQFYQPQENSGGQFYQPKENNGQQSYQPKENNGQQFYLPNENSGRHFYQPKENNYRQSYQPKENDAGQFHQSKDNKTFPELTPEHRILRQDDPSSISHINKGTAFNLYGMQTPRTVLLKGAQNVAVIPALTYNPSGRQIPIHGQKSWFPAQASVRQHLQTPFVRYIYHHVL